MTQEFNNPLDRMQSYYSDFSKTDENIAVYILNNPRVAATSSTEDIGKAIHVSKSALSRFAKRIGYPGFNEFRYDLSRFLISQNSVEKDDESKPPLIAITDTYREYLSLMAKQCSEEQITRIAQEIASARLIKIFAVNRTYNSALHFKQRLGRAGYDSEAIYDTTTMADAVNILGKDDVAIFLTIRNKIKYDSYVKALYEKGCPVICITMSQDLAFKRYCKEYAVLPRISRNSSMTFLDDQPLFLVYLETVLAELAKI